MFPKIYLNIIIHKVINNGFEKRPAVYREIPLSTPTDMYEKNGGCDLYFHTWLHTLWLMGVLKCKSLITLSIQAGSHIHTYTQCKTHNYWCDEHMQTQWWTLMGSQSVVTWPVIDRSSDSFLSSAYGCCVISVNDSWTGPVIQWAEMSIHYSSLLAAESDCVSVCWRLCYTVYPGAHWKNGNLKKMCFTWCPLNYLVLFK